MALTKQKTKLFYHYRGVFTAPLHSDGHGPDLENTASKVPLLLRVHLLPWEPVCLSSLPSNGSPCYNMLQISKQW
jgi:hypothetical protein